MQKSKSQAEIAQQRCERFGDRQGPKKTETRSRVRVNGGLGPDGATASNRRGGGGTTRRSGADEGGQAFGSSRAPRRGNSLRGGIGLASGVAGRSSLRRKALWAGKALESSWIPVWKRSWRRPRQGSARQEGQRYGRSPPARGNARKVSGRTIRRSEIGGMNRRYPWSDQRGQPRRSSVSGTERSPGAKQAFTENSRGTGAHDEVIDGRIGSYVSRVNGAGRRKAVRSQSS